MDIACPHCAATYRVPDALVDGVNALRCAACEQAWVPAPPRPEQDPPPPHAAMQERVPAVEDAASPPEPEPEPWPEPEPEPAPAAPPEPFPCAVPSALPPSPLPSDTDATHVLSPTRAGPPGLAPRRLPEPPAKRRAAPSRLAVAWSLSIAAVFAFVMVLVLFQAQITALWPPFARLAG